MAVQRTWIGWRVRKLVLLGDPFYKLCFGGAVPSCIHIETRVKFDTWNSVPSTKCGA